jgi:hypothetical protein
MNEFKLANKKNAKSNSSNQPLPTQQQQQQQVRIHQDVNIYHLF